MTSKAIGHLLYTTSSFVHHFNPTDRRTDGWTEKQTERQTDRKTDSNFLKENPFENVIYKMLVIFFRPKYRLIWSLFFIKVYQSTKAKKRNSAHFKISEKILYQSKKNHLIHSQLHRSTGYQIKVKAVLNNFCNFIPNPCKMYVPISYTNLQYVQLA